MKKHPAFHRTELLIGETALEKLAATRVILFGVGGVGSWCAEALIRSGVGHLTVVDNDVICVTNINRQLQATSKNIGQPKVLALQERLLAIHPDAEVLALQKVYNQETRAEFNLSSYDYVIDAIDSLSHKVDLIASAMEAGVTLFSAMGAANKLDATTIRVDSIWKSQGCRLAKFVRKRLRSRGVSGDCLCVYSEEILSPVETDPTDEAGDAWSGTKAQINGSMVHITGAFGFNLAGLVVQDVVRKFGGPSTSN
ncbi:MAG: tRNA threonylcarbamoyladenosine dehydratase [Pontiellaceae bacterium]|jgi:tRNA A37 threonylcarbamoyladenosine dehydratase|nr:tRNA threonylcarbamoyladenosine dehydratase [Pontiellaceae bacterium]